MLFKNPFKSTPKRAESATAQTPVGPSESGPDPLGNSAMQDQMKASQAEDALGSEASPEDAQGGQKPKAKLSGLGRLFHKTFKTGAWKQEEADEAEAERLADEQIDNAINGLKYPTLLGDLRATTFDCLRHDACEEVVSFIETLDGEHDSRHVWDTFLRKGAPEEVNAGAKELAELSALAEAGLYDAMDFEPLRAKVLFEPMQQVRQQMLFLPEVRDYVGKKLGLR